MAHKKYHVGRFSISDRKSIFSVSSSVEIKDNDIKGLVWLNLDSMYKYSSKAIQMLFDIVEVRSFAYLLKAIYRSNQNEEYQKSTGGTDTTKTVFVSRDIKNATIKMVTNGSTISIVFPPENLLGLSDEISKLADVLSDAVYKTQQKYRNKKKT